MTAAAQGTSASHQRTTPPPEARYEIISSELAAKHTFRLDRFTGQTAQLVMQDDSTLTWELILKQTHPLGDTRTPGRANYQMFSSGLAARYTFLINVNTGSTWQIEDDPAEGLFWAPLYTKTSKKPR
jgi:hypothetical protein